MGNGNSPTADVVPELAGQRDALALDTRGSSAVVGEHPIGRKVSMRTLSLVTGSMYLLLAAALGGCGGGEAPPPKAPEGPPAKAVEKQPAPTQGEAAEESKAEAKAEKKPSHKPAKEVIGDPDLSFQYSFRDSDVRQKMEETCAKKAKDDPAKKADCMSKAQADVEGEHLRFIKLDGDNWYVVVKAPPGKELHRIKYTIAKDSPDQVTIKFIPPDKAKQPKGKLPPELTFDIIDDYTIVIDDPAQGKMVYRGKTGLFTETSTSKGGAEAPAGKSKSDKPEKAEKPEKPEKPKK